MKIVYNNYRDTMMMDISLTSFCDVIVDVCVFKSLPHFRSPRINERPSCCRVESRDHIAVGLGNLSYTSNLMRSRCTTFYTRAHFCVLMLLSNSQACKSLSKKPQNPSIAIYFPLAGNLYDFWPTLIFIFTSKHKQCPEFAGYHERRTIVRGKVVLAMATDFE